MFLFYIFLYVHISTSFSCLFCLFVEVLITYLDFWLSNLLVDFFQYELFSRTVSYIHSSNLNFCRIRLFPIVGFILFSRYSCGR
jgi:hypothetical protein